MKRTSAFVLACVVWIVQSSSMAHCESAVADSGDLRLDSLLRVDVSAAAKHEPGSEDISAAAKHAQDATDAPASATVITSQDIERYGFQTLADVLASVRGFYTAYDYNYSYAGVNGFSRPGDFNDRILLLWNGHTLNEDIYGSAALGTELGIDLDHVSRIEVVRGPGSALYGTGAMFAVINVITKDGNRIDGAEGSTQIGSQGRFGGAAAFGKEFASGLDLAINATWTGNDGSDIRFDGPNGGTLTHELDWDRFRGVSAQGRYAGLTVNGFVVSRRKGVPTGSYESILGDPRTQSRDQRMFLDLKYDAKLQNRLGLMLRAYLDQYIYDDTWAYELTQRDSARGEWLGLEGQARWDINPSNRVILGTEIQDHRRASYQAWNQDSVLFEGDYPFNVRSVFLQDESELGSNIALTAGLRYDHYSQSGSALSPRVAIILYPREEETLKLLFGEAFRAPSTAERAIGNVAVVQQNLDLKPETIKTYELVWERRLNRRLFAVASLYHYKMHDLIDQVEDSLTGQPVFENVSRAIATGASGELSLDLPGDRDLSLSYSYQYAKDPDRKTHLTNSPEHLIQVRASTPLVERFRLSATGRWESSRTTVHDTRTNPFLLASANLLFRPAGIRPSNSTSFWGRTQMALMVDNLLNNGYELPAGTEQMQVALPQYGRRITLKLSVEW